MPIAEMAEALFAGVDATAITTCGTAVQELSKLYGTLGTAIDTAHQTLFSGKNSWGGSAASSAKTSMTSLSSSNGNVQSALSTIGQTLTEYGAAMTPYQKKTYPTPIPGSRDPEAAADLAVVGLASTVAAASIGTAVLQMMPVANPGKGQNSPPKPGAVPHLTNHTTLPATPNLHLASHLAAMTNLPSPLGSVSPGSSNGLLPNVAVPDGAPLLTPGLLGVGPGPGVGLGSEVGASEAARAPTEEPMPMAPMVGGNRKPGDSETTRAFALAEDADFWSENQSHTVQGVIGALPA